MYNLFCKKKLLFFFSFLFDECPIHLFFFWFPRLLQSFFHLGNARLTCYCKRSGLGGLGQGPGGGGFASGTAHRYVVNSPTWYHSLRELWSSTCALPFRTSLLFAFSLRSSKLLRDGPHGSLVAVAVRNKFKQFSKEKEVKTCATIELECISWVVEHYIEVFRKGTFRLLRKETLRFSPFRFQVTTDIPTYLMQNV